MKEPVAKICPRELTTHGDIRIDNYYWLNERENPEVIAYLEQENLYQETMMKDTESLQNELYDEIVGRIKQDDVSYPIKRNGYYYYSRYEEGQEYPVYCRRKDNMDNPEETANTLRLHGDGRVWLHTGDMARQDEDGFIFLVDRKKDVIISGGENLYPVQIEDFIRTNPKVHDVAVIGLPHKRLGEIAAAIVQIKEGVLMKPEELDDFCKALPRYKRPHKIIFAEVPRNPTGKIEKPKLREKYGADKLIADGFIGGGMLPKLNNCTSAIKNGVNRVHILDGRRLHCLLLEFFTRKGIGTAIVRDEKDLYPHEFAGNN